GVEGDAENWMLENLAEMLREHPRATAVLVVREPSEAIEIGSEDEAVSAVEPALVSEEKIPVDAGDASATSGVAVEPETEIEISMTDLAGKWKNILETKHGVEAGRIVVREGHRTSWGNGKLTTWVVPHGVELPDPFADPDEQEELEGESSGQVGVDSEPEELSKSPPHDIPAPISPKTEATPAGLTQHKPGN
ncbi:MAG: hypothetical protein ACRD9R_20760, partial [Pyrinomonadaceae bacterium]